jgi:two-component system, sensor histidine kinase and response regulator
MSLQNPVKARVVIVDDDPAQVRALSSILADHGYETTGFTRPAQALTAIRPGRFELLLSDMNMPDISGINLLEAAQQIDPDLVGVIMTGEGTIQTAVEAMRTGAFDYILKPFKLSSLIPVLARALAVRDLRIEVAKLEQSVRERSIELESANKELEAFAYSVSHDLRSPLTVVVGYLDVLIAQFATGLPPMAQTILESTLKSALRMNELIEDLLRLSRMNREPLSKERVDVRALVNEVVGELRPSWRGRQVEVLVGDLPETTGDPGLLKQVFTNLLSNAIKFTRDKDLAIVEVSCIKEGAETVYFVRDNGAGFDMRHAKNLFGAFQRLHSPGKFEGTGVGLSIVHRVVSRHGGRVWAEAEVGKGAAFFFSLGCRASSMTASDRADMFSPIGAEAPSSGSGGLAKKVG